MGKNNYRLTDLVEVLEGPFFFFTTMELALEDILIIFYFPPIHDTLRRRGVGVVDVGKMSSRTIGIKRSCRNSYRYRCPNCKQMLGYTAYSRHKSLPQQYCFGARQRKIREGLPEPKSSTSNSSSDDDNAFNDDQFLDQDSSSNHGFESPKNDERHESSSGSSSSPTAHDDDDHSDSRSSDSSSESSIGAEIWDEMDETSSSSEEESLVNQSNVKREVIGLKYMVCLFISFFKCVFVCPIKRLSAF